MGFRADLSAGEIVEQLMHAQLELCQKAGDTATVPHNAHAP